MDIQTKPHEAVPHLAFLYQTAVGANRLPTRLALGLADKAGTTTMFYGLVLWQAVWMLLATLGVNPFGHDKYPFIFLLFLGNLIQLWYLPLLQIQQKRDAELQEAKAAADHRSLTHIANTVDLIADHFGVQGKVDSPSSALQNSREPEF